MKQPVTKNGSGEILLERLAIAFANGKNRPSSPSTRPKLRQFMDLLDDSIRRKIAPDEWSFIQSCLHQAHEALQSARQDRLEEAHRQAEEMWQCVRSRSRLLSLEGRLLLEVFLKPGDAYRRYKLEDYDEARAMVRHISQLDQRLVTEFGFVFLGAHRLQLADNLLRIHTRLGERRDAMRMGGTLLDYLELRVEPPSDDLLCARAVLDSVPDEVLEYYFDKVCGELAVMLAGDTDGTTSELLQPLIHHADPAGCLGSRFGSHAHEWIHIKLVALRGEVEAFLELATNLLQRGRRSEPSLWFATIIDVVGMCRSLGPEASKLADRMVAEASKLSDAPWGMKQAASEEYGRREPLKTRSSA